MESCFGVGSRLVRLTFPLPMGPGAGGPRGQQVALIITWLTPARISEELESRSPVLLDLPSLPSSVPTSLNTPANVLNGIMHQDAAAAAAAPWMILIGWPHSFPFANVCECLPSQHWCLQIA